MRVHLGDLERENAILKQMQQQNTATEPAQSEQASGQTVPAPQKSPRLQGERLTVETLQTQIQETFAKPITLNRRTDRPKCVSPNNTTNATND